MTKESKEKNQYMRAGIAYTFGSFLLKGLGFITVPVFARLLSTEDFGIYNTFLSYEGILYLFSGMCLHMSIHNAKIDYGSDQLDQYCSNISLIPVLNTVVLLTLAAVLADELECILEIDVNTLFLLIIYSFGNSIIIMYQHRQTTEYQYKNYLKVSYTNALSHIILSIILVVAVFDERRYLGRIVGNVVPIVFIAAIVLLSWYRKTPPCMNWEQIRYGLRISLPIVPHGLGQVILTSFDRIMISNMVGYSEAGIYSFSYTIFSFLQIISNSLQSVFKPWVYEHIADRKKIQNISGLFFGVLCFFTIGIVLISPEMIQILGGEKYQDSVYTVIPVMIGGLFSMAYGIPAILEYYHKKTNYIAVGTVGAAALNVVLNYVCINQYGYIAAAYTTLAAYAAYYIFHTIISYKVGKFLMIPIKTSVIGFSVVFLVAIITFITLHHMLIRITLVLTITLVAVVLLYQNKNRIRVLKGRKNENQK